MKTLTSLRLVPVWLGPEHLAATARIVMEGHGLRALGVVDELRQLIGVVTLESTLTASDGTVLEKLIKPAELILDPESAIREAVDEFVERKIDYAPLVIKGQYHALVTSSMLLERMRQSWDPLTELPWSDELRNWGAEQLKSGTDIAILFLDLNDFGAFNKRYGHVIGDRVLKRFADFLSSNTDSAHEMVVRFGGDEFAIGTNRDRDGADDLAAKLLEQGKELSLPEIDETIHFALGVHGGRRSKERLNVHFGATLDNLINLASQDCLSHKQPKTTAVVYMSPPSAPIVPPSVMASVEESHTGAPEVTPINASQGSVFEAQAQTSLPIVEAETVTNGLQISSSEEPKASDTFNATSDNLGVSAGVATADPIVLAEITESTVGLPDKGGSAIEEESNLQFFSPQAAILVDSEPEAETQDEEEPLPTVLAVQVEESPNSLTHVAIRTPMGVFFGVGVRMGRTLFDSIAYATGKALERAYQGSIINVDSVRTIEENGVESVQIEARVSDGYLERKVVSVVEYDEDRNASVALATIAAFFAK